MDKIVAIALSSSLMTCLSVGAQSKSWAQVAPFLFLAQAQVPAQSDEGMAIEEALPQDSSKRMDRLAKNDRHNGGGCNLTTATADHPCFFESIWPRALPLIPLKKTALAVAGQVVKIQPYVSGDGSRIYREITIDVDEVYKRPRGFELSRDRTILIDEPGGAIRLQSGAIVRDGTVICGLGQPMLEGTTYSSRTRFTKDWI